MQRQRFIARSYQASAVDYILQNERSCLFAGMGTGKTVSSLTAIDGLFMAGVLTKPVLVLAPLLVASNTWPDEAAKWEHLSNIEVSAIVGTAEQRKAALKKKVNVYTINYENLPWLRETLGKNWPFGMVIADESTRLKSFRLMQGGQRARALAGVAHLPGSRWVNLTGTPTGNGLQNLWGQMWFIDQGKRLGHSFTAFEQRWFVKGYNGYGLEPRESAQAEIQERIKDVCLTLDIRDFYDIKQPIVTRVGFDLPDKAKAHYREMERDMFTEILNNPVEAFSAGSKSMKCRQLAAGFAYREKNCTDFIETHDKKLQVLESILQEANGSPVIVSYYFQASLERLKKAFPKGRVLDKNPKTIRDWNAGKIPVLFAHPQSAAHGLNLQHGGNILVFYDLDWSAELHDQIIERIGPTRQMQSGYDRHVFIYYIEARGTVDELMFERVMTHKSIQDILLEAMKRKGYA